jgi:hypothetical protein
MYLNFTCVYSNIRLDFGDNPEQVSVVVNSMKLKYLNNEFIATKDLVTQYFYLFNEQVKYDATQVFNNYVKQGRTCL